jgi:hypothetical protein
MSHPADGEAWQDFDRVYPDFAKDARNLRLGLATDRFNPFLEKNTKYSMCPVFVVLTRCSLFQLVALRTWMRTPTSPMKVMLLLLLVGRTMHAMKVMICNNHSVSFFR